MKLVLMGLIFLVSSQSFAIYELSRCGAPIAKSFSIKHCAQVNGEFATKNMVIYSENYQEGFDIVEAKLYFKLGEKNCWSYGEDESICFDYLNDFPSGDGPI